MPSSPPTPVQKNFVAKVQRRVSFPIRVVSYGRTPHAQADAMLAKYRAAGGGSAGARELHDTYQDDRAISDLLSLPKTVEAWGARIAARYPRLSRHLWKGAVDLSLSGLSGHQLVELEAAVVAEGGRPSLESTPKHLHVDLPVSLVGRGPGADDWTFSHPAESLASGGDSGGGILLAVGAIVTGAWLRSRRASRR